MRSRIALGALKVCTGRRGTVIFCDTSGLHRGGYATSGNRIMFTAVYASEASFKYASVPLFRFPPNFSFGAENSLSDAARYALEPIPKTAYQYLASIEKKLR